MHDKQPFVLSSLWCFLVPILVVGALGGCASQPRAATSPTAVLANSIVVMGTGEAKLAPNVAEIRVGVEGRAADAKSAITQVNQQVARVIAALKQQGVRDADIQTENLSLHSEREVRPVPLEPDGVSASASGAERVDRTVYRASNQLVVKLRDLSRIGDTLGAAIDGGANTLFGLSFDVDDKKPLREQARTLAMADARAKAEQLARLANVQLGPVISVFEPGGEMPGPMPMAQVAFSKESSVPVEAGTVSIEQTLRVVYAIEGR